MTTQSLAPLSLMLRHVEALFTHTSDSRLLTVNDGSDTPAPRFFLGRTSDGIVQRFAAGLPEAMIDELGRIGADERPIDSNNLKLPVGHDQYARLLALSHPTSRVEAGPCYWLPSGVAPKYNRQELQGDICLVNETNSGVLTAHMSDWLDALDWQPIVAVLHEGNAVSVCASVRRTAAAHEAGVKTAPAFRRRGFARHAVIAWLSEVDRLGVTRLYSTSWENAASRALAVTLGLEMFGVNFHIT